MAKRDKKNKKKKTSPYDRCNPDARVIDYRGPIDVPGTNEQIDHIAVNIHYVVGVSSSAAGVINAIYRSDPSAGADWASFTSAYHEYRVLAMRVRYEPSNRYSKTTTICQPLVTVVDHNNGSALGSYAAAYGHQSAKLVTLEDPWVRNWRMHDVQEADFIETTVAPTQVSGVKLYADSLSVSTTYGMVFITWLVQFRGRA